MCVDFGGESFFLYSIFGGNVHELSSKNMLGYSATRGLHEYADPKFEHGVGEWGNTHRIVSNVAIINYLLRATH